MCELLLWALSEARGSVQGLPWGASNLFSRILILLIFARNLRCSQNLGLGGVAWRGVAWRGVGGRRVAWDGAILWGVWCGERGGGRREGGWRTWTTTRLCRGEVAASTLFVTISQLTRTHEKVRFELMMWTSQNEDQTGGGSQRMDA